MLLPKLKLDNLPKAPRLAKLIGPSFIMLGLGLGSGELILWPYLSANYGLGIIWGALLGITFQFFLNMEIERYALVTGESVFVGLARKLKIISPIWFILSTLIPWMWPGIIASSGTLIAHVFGIEYAAFIPILLLILIGAILSLGPVIYKTQERFQKTLILIGVPFIIILTFYFAKTSDWIALGKGLAGIGNGYLFFPIGISLGTFLGAFAYAGAGGNLNLAQSFYIKEKGYGMGKFSGRITSILTGKSEKIALTGTTFIPNEENINKFRTWWKRINIEHFAVFWATGAFTMIMLSLFAYSTLKDAGITEGISFLIEESKIVSAQTIPFLGTIFLIIAAVMLFSTQFSVLDATSRIMSENIVILNQKIFKVEKLPYFYYSFLWVQIIAGVVIFSLGFTAPLTLVVIGAVLNALTMFVYTGLILWLNRSSLSAQLRPGIIRQLFLLVAFVFYGTFSGITIFQYFR